MGSTSPVLHLGRKKKERTLNDGLHGDDLEMAALRLATVLPIFLWNVCFLGSNKCIVSCLINHKLE